MSKIDREKVLSKAKIKLMGKGSTFLCTIILSLRYEWRYDIPTAGVDGVSMIINPDWFCTLTVPQQVGLLAHEGWHIALNHVGEKGRRGERNAKIFNDAGDYVINLIVTQAGMEIPPNGLLDIMFDDWTTNKVYDYLIDQGGDPDTGDMAGDIMPSVLSEEEYNAAIKQLLVKAATQSKLAGEKPGDLPAGLDRQIQELINPILPWDAILDRFLTNMVPEDYSWRRPNRRFIPQHYLPTKHSESLAHLIIAIDTSGSVTEEMMKKILSEITYIKTKFNPKLLTILDCDTKIHNIYDVTESDNIGDLTFSGYGGTRCAPPIEYAKDNAGQALIYFSDGDFTPYNGDVNFPLLWIIYDDKNWTSNIGEVIYYNG